MMNKENACIYELKSKGRQTYPFALEHVLPDYLPDVRKMLMCSPRIKSFQFQPDTDQLHFGGELSTTLLFMSEEGKLLSTVLTQNFACTADANGVNPESVLFALPRIIKSEARALSPRKITLKSEVEIAYKVFSLACVSPQVKGGKNRDDELTVEKKSSAFLSSRFEMLKESELRISQDVLPDASQGQISDLLICDIRPSTDEIRCFDGRASVKGRVFADLLCRGEGDPADEIRIQQVFPFSIQLDDPRLTPDSILQGQFCVKDIEAQVQNDAYGERRLIELDCSLIGQFMLSNAMECMTVADAFSTAFESELSYQTLPGMLALSSFSVSVSDECECGSLGEENGRAVFARVSPTDVSVREENGRLAFDVNSLVTCLTAKDGIDPYEISEKNVTAKVVTSLPIPDGSYDAEAVCSAVVTGMRIDGGTIRLRYELLLTAFTSLSTSCQSVSAITLHREKPIKEKRNMILVYPNADEQSWDIAKRYHIPTAAAAAGKRGEDGSYYCLRPGRFVGSGIMEAK